MSDFEAIEARAIDLFRRLSERDKARVLQTLQVLIELPEPEEQGDE